MSMLSQQLHAQGRAARRRQRATQRRAERTAERRLAIGFSKLEHELRELGHNLGAKHGRRQHTEKVREEEGAP